VTLHRTPGLRTCPSALVLDHSPDAALEQEPRGPAANRTPSSRQHSREFPGPPPHQARAFQGPLHHRVPREFRGRLHHRVPWEFAGPWGPWGSWELVSWLLLLPLLLLLQGARGCLERRTQPLGESWVLPLSSSASLLQPLGWKELLEVEQ